MESGGINEFLIDRMMGCAFEYIFKRTFYRGENGIWKLLVDN